MKHGNGRLRAQDASVSLSVLDELTSDASLPMVVDQGQQRASDRSDQPESRRQRTNDFPLLMELVRRRRMQERKKMRDFGVTVRRLDRNAKGSRVRGQWLREWTGSVQCSHVAVATAENIRFNVFAESNH